jgi:coiled-coil domain-containing protein 12
MSSHTSLDAQANERKARLAQLKSLKRKQPSSTEYDHDQTTTNADTTEDTTPDVTTLHLSGRNYDPVTRGPKLGFEAPPPTNAPTLETLAQNITSTTKALQEAEESQPDKAIDLFKLQPKKPNWDLKRDVDKKMERLNVRTENAIAMLVRERVRKAQESTGGKEREGEGVGMEGVALVEGVHLREREEEEDERREREEEEDIA